MKNTKLKTQNEKEKIRESKKETIYKNKKNTKRGLMTY
jgi:hypothetical protein